MPSVVVPASLTGGITQNPPETADPGRIRDSQNFVPLPKSGLSRRAGTDWLTEALSDPALEAALWPVDLGPRDRYVAVVSHGQVKVFRPNGGEVEVKAVTRDADGNVTGGAAPDFSYLHLRTPQPLSEPESFLVTAGPWSTGGSAQNPVFGAGPASPLGFPEDSAFPAQDTYTLLSISAGVGNDGHYLQVANGHLWDRLWGLSVYVNLTVPDVLPDTFRLAVQDPAAVGSPKFDVDFDLTGGPTALPAASSSDGFVTFVERVPDTTTEYRLGFVFDPARVAAPTGPGNTIQAYVELIDGTSAGDPSQVYAWGALLLPYVDTAALPRYAEPPEVLRRTAALSTTFVANPLVPTRLAPDTAPSFADAYPNRTFTGVGAGSNETNVPVADAGFIAVNQAVASVVYRVEVVLEDTTGGGGTKTLDVSDTAAATPSTSAIAGNLATNLNADPLNTDAGVGGNEARILEATAVGHVVQMETKANDGETWTIQQVRVYTVNGGSMVGFTSRIDSPVNLPLIARDGHVVRVVEAVPEGDFAVAQQVLRFDADEDGAFGSGVWVEGVDYGLRTTLDASTLPHILARRVDNAAGLVTGKGGAVYFEWGPFDTGPLAGQGWSDRLVGDDATNPYPSFVTPPSQEFLADRTVDAIGFYANRLVIGSGLNLALSEVNGYGNFWRSQIASLPDSDRIDVTVSTPDAGRIRDVGVGAGTLFIITNRAIQAVTFSGLLSPRTIGVETAYVMASDAPAQSAPATRGIFVPGCGCDDGGLFFLFPSDDSTDTVTFDAAEVTEVVPHLLEGGVYTLAWGAPLLSAFVHTRDAPASLYGLRIAPRSGGGFQLAWYPFGFSDDPVQSAAALGGDLYVLLEREGASHLERLPLDERPRDPGQTWRLRADRRITEADFTTAVTYAAGTDTSTITLPYSRATARTPIVAPRSGSSFGVPYTVLGSTATTVDVRGDVRGLEILVGEAFESSAEPLRPVLRRRGVDAPEPLATAATAAREVAVAVADSGALDVAAVAADGSESVGQYPTPVPNTLRSGILRSGVFSEGELARVVLRTSSHQPLNLTALEWLLDVDDPAPREL